MFQKLEIKLVEWANTELVATWLSGTLSTITSNVFTELTIRVTRMSFSLRDTDENQLCGWNSVDNMLDRLSLCEDVTLVMRLQYWVTNMEFGELMEKYFPLMWENGRVVLEMPPPYMDNGPLKRTRIGPAQAF